MVYGKSGHQWLIKPTTSTCFCGGQCVTITCSKALRKMTLHSHLSRFCVAHWHQWMGGQRWQKLIARNARRFFRGFLSQCGFSHLGSWEKRFRRFWFWFWFLGHPVRVYVPFFSIIVNPRWGGCAINPKIVQKSRNSILSKSFWEVNAYFREVRACFREARVHISPGN